MVETLVPVRKDRLLPGQGLAFGQSLYSPNGNYRLTFQSDGNLVLRRNDFSNRDLWASGTWGKGASSCTMQGDGNLVIYAGQKALWDTATWGHPGAWFAVQSDGNLVVYAAAKALWASNTVQNWSIPPCRFHLEIHTADEASAGTDSNIFVILFGEHGQTNEYRLNQFINHDAFERNTTESVYLDHLPYLGRIYKVQVRSDTAYWASDWRLSWIRVTPEYPTLPVSMFRYEDWIKDTSAKTIHVDDWPWSVGLGQEFNDQAIARTIALQDTLAFETEFTQELSVGYEITDQVAVTTSVKDTTQLMSKITWESPLKALTGFTGEIGATWTEEINNLRVDTSTVKITITDKRTLKFPPGHVTFVMVDWTELWVKQLASLGSTTLALRSLSAIPSNPSWTLASYAKGENVPEPYASWLRQHRPDLVSQFVLP